MHFVFVTQHSRTHRIEMHIVAYLPQISASAPVHQKRFVAAAKKMAAKAIASIELLSVGTRVGAVANPLVREKESDCATEIKETDHNGGELQAKA